MYYNYAYMHAQVLSRSTSEALKFYKVYRSAATQTFLLFMDRFFDMLNVRSPKEFAHKHKDDLKPYTSPEDSLLMVILYPHTRIKRLYNVKRAYKLNMHFVF